MNTPENNVAADVQLNKNDVQYSFFLYVKGASPNSMLAINNLKQLFEVHLNGKYSLKVIDVHQQSVTEENELLIALPLVVRMYPLPQRRCIGDMSDVQNVLTTLGLLNCL